MDNPEKLATQITLNVEKQNKNTTQYVLDTTMRKQTQKIVSTKRYLVFSNVFPISRLETLCPPNAKYTLIS